MSAITNQKFNVTGMSCASCSAHVEKAVRNVTGVTDVAVNLLTNSMIVSYDTPATAALICEAVSKAGYGTASGNSAAGSSSSATIGTASGNSTAGSSSSASMSAARAQLEDHESPLMIKR
ncbi:MAG: heavy metal-associated domain-containing protein, partial [Lachnospiraceae bacterium]